MHFGRPSTVSSIRGATRSEIMHQGSLVGGMASYRIVGAKAHTSPATSRMDVTSTTDSALE
eukprot:6973350-Pyramimonas_sp.AAC.1